MANDDSIKYIWQGKKLICGMPISFTKYAMSEDRLFFESGLLSTQLEEILLYRIKDISVKRSLWQKIFGVGTVTLYTSDTDQKKAQLVNIADSIMVKELIHQYVEKIKQEKGMRFTEFVDDVPTPPSM